MYNAAVTTVWRYGNGAYLRDGDGEWRYADSLSRVPGAHDLLLRDRFSPERTLPWGPHGWAFLPRPQALTDPDLRWVPDGQAAGRPRSEAHPGKLGVPWPEWEEHAGTVVGMDAPELHPANLLTVADVGRLAGFTPEVVMDYVRRGSCPGPTVRLNRTPLWSRPVVVQWLARRRRRGSTPYFEWPMHLVRDPDAGAVAVQAGKVAGSPWSLVVTVEDLEPRIVDLTRWTLLSDILDSPFRLEHDSTGVHLWWLDDGQRQEIPGVQKLVADWAAAHPELRTELVPAKLNGADQDRR